MSIWESVGSPYVEAATAALPLHRLVLFGSGLLSALAVKSQTHLSIVETISRTKLLSLAEFSTGPFSTATLGDILIGVSAVVAAWALWRALVLLVFELAAKATKIVQRAQDALNSFQLPAQLADRQAAIEVIRTSLEAPRSRLRALNAFAESSCGVGLVLLIASYWGNRLDLVVGATLMLLALGLITVAVRCFLADYFGPATLMAALQGRPHPTPLNVS